MEWNEGSIGAAKREIFEEVGCLLDGAQEVVAFVENVCGATLEVHVVVGTINMQPRADGREIVEAAFHSPKNFPDDVFTGLTHTIPVWISLWNKFPVATRAHGSETEVESPLEAGTLP